MYEGPEALEWLRRSRSPSALAPNRFGTTGDAIAFVELLYTAGAVRVVVPSQYVRDDPLTVETEGGPRAAGLAVHLPVDPARREALVWLCGWELGAGHTHSNPATLAAFLGRPVVFLGWTQLPPMILPFAFGVVAKAPPEGSLPPG